MTKPERQTTKYSKIQTCIKRSLFGTKKNWSIEIDVGDLLKKDQSVHVKFSMMGQEKCDLLMQVTA
jgi:hypothetical protein